MQAPGEQSVSPGFCICGERSCAAASRAKVSCRSYPCFPGIPGTFRTSHGVRTGKHTDQFIRSTACQPDRNLCRQLTIPEHCTLHTVNRLPRRRHVHCIGHPFQFQNQNRSDEADWGCLIRPSPRSDVRSGAFFFQHSPAGCLDTPDRSRQTQVDQRAAAPPESRPSVRSSAGAGTQPYMSCCNRFFSSGRRLVSQSAFVRTRVPSSIVSESENARLSGRSDTRRHVSVPIRTASV